MMRCILLQGMSFIQLPRLRSISIWITFILGGGKTCVYLTLDLNVIAVYTLTKHPNCGETNPF